VLLRTAKVTHRNGNPDDTLVDIRPQTSRLIADLGAPVVSRIQTLAAP
jgi:hypothetical protein